MRPRAAPALSKALYDGPPKGKRGFSREDHTLMSTAHFNFILSMFTLPAGLAAVIIGLFFGTPALASLCLALFALGLYASLPAIEPVQPTAE